MASRITAPTTHPATHGSPDSTSHERCGRGGRGVRRSRWAAIGAAVAVSLGAGGVALVGASGSAPSAFVAITPERILDTRPGVGIGLDGPFTSPSGRTLHVTGAVPTSSGTHTVVPAGATAVVLNVTAVQPSNDGFVSVRPDDTPGPPATSNLNVVAGAIVPNAVTVALPTDGPHAGAIDVVYDAFGLPGATSDMLIDVTGYFLEGAGGTGDGAQGPAGPQGPTGPAGPQGDQGESAFEPANVVHVAQNGTPDGSNGAFDNVQAAIDSITDAASNNRYVVKIGPGTFHGRVNAKSFVSLEGSGVHATRLQATGGSALPSQSGDSATINLEFVQRVQIRHLEVASTQGAATAAIRVVGGGSLIQISDVTAIGSSGTTNAAIYLGNSSPEIRDVLLISAPATGSSATGLQVDGGEPTLLNAQIRIGPGTGTTRGVSVSGGGNARLVNVTTDTALSSNPTAIHVNAASATVWDSSLAGNPVMSTSSDMSGNVPSIGVANTQLVGNLSPGPYNCVGAFNEEFSTLGSSCQ
jgi:hypothetical protein